MNILVTNDDGDTIGLRILLEVAKKFGNAYAIIPHRQRSAVSKSITLHKALRFHRIEEEMYEINGTPADAVLFSIYSKEVPKPDLVLSGINFGDNTSLTAILSSGTIGACWEALIENIPTIAFSLYRTSKDWHDKKNWGNLELLKDHTGKIIKLLKDKSYKDKFYSVNFPNDLSNSKTLFHNRLQRTRFNVHIDKRIDPSEHAYYWLSGDFSKLDKGTDSYEVGVNKNIVITEVSIKDFDVSSK